MKKLWVYLKDYKKECTLAPLFKMLEASFELIIPLVVAAIIDTGIAGSDRGYIVKMCSVMIALGVIGLICSITAQYFSARAAVGFSANLRSSLLSHLNGLSFSEVDTLGTSTMITRMTSDVNQAQTGVNMVLRLFLRSPFVVIGAMVMAFTIDVKAAVSFVLAILFLSLVVFGIMAVTMPMLKNVQKHLDGVLAITRENLAGVRVIRAFCKEEEEIDRFYKRNEALAAKQKKTGSITALMNPITYVIINAAVISLIWTGAIQVDAGILSQGQVVALYNYMSQILVELIKFANFIITVNKASASAKRISDVFEISSSMEWSDQEQSIQSGAGIYEDAVTFRHVSLTYQGGGEEALTDIDFSIRRGDTIGIIGGTGSGKTSVVHLIPRFYDATNGVVLINGVDVKSYSKEALRSKIGIVMQKAVLFQGSIAKNLRWGKENASKEELMEAVKIAQAEDVVTAKGGYDAVITQGGKNLSGGQRQRLTIARALVRKPEILILDDSASALDLATDARLRHALKELDYHPTVFIVSQRTNALMDADMILVMEDGKIVGKGTHLELLKSCEIYREIYNSQCKLEAAE